MSVNSAISNSPINVLFLCSWFPNANNPTLGNFVQKHAEAAAKFNTIHTLAVFPKSDGPMFDVVQNTPTETVIYYRSAGKGLLGKLISRLRYFRACKKGYKIARNQLKTIDLVHLNVALPMGLFAVYLQRVKRIPFVVTEHATAYAKGPNQYPQKTLRRAVRILNKAALLLPVSDDLGKTLGQLAPKVPQRTISNVVNEAIFTEKQPTDRLKKRLLHISTAVDAHKNVTGILEVFARVVQQRSDVELVIVSDGNLTPHKETAKKLGILETFVHFETTKTTHEIAAMLQASDALLLFSNYENFPCVIAESLMVGTPVISSNVNGIPEHVNETNGKLVAPKDQQALETAINDVLDTCDQYPPNKLRDYALEHFSYEGVGKKLDAVYRSLLNRL